MRRLAPEEVDLWRRAMRDVAPLRNREGERWHPAGSAKDAGKMPAMRSPPAFPGMVPKSLPAQPPAAPPLDRFAGVDRATAERVKRGRYPVAARLDLHGLTQEVAHEALGRFIAGARAQGKRCVLVITGHGRMSGGILKTAVPRWLAEPAFRRDVLALAPARPPHGGSGALYVLLRRPPPD